MPRIFGTPISSYLPPAILWLMAAGYLILAGQYEEQSRMMPLLIGRVMLVLATLDLVSRSKTPIGQTLLRWLNPAAVNVELTHGRPDARREFGYILWIMAFVIGLILVGMFVAVPIFLLVSFSVLGRRTIIESVLLTAVVSAAVWMLFSLLLHLQLFPGLVFHGQL